MALPRLPGLRRKFNIDGVRYRECTGESLRRALSPKGRGHKAFDVTFRDGSTMRIEATPRRRFADITGASLLDAYRAAQSILRPGMRIVILESGTGAAGAWAARLVGQAGAVVALDRDQQSIDYALRRYPLPNISFEVGGIEALDGETDGAFDAALAIEAFSRDDDAAKITRELWRTLGAAGILLIAAPVESVTADHRRPFKPEELAEMVEAALRGGERPEQVSIFRRSDLAVAIARRRPEE